MSEIRDKSHNNNKNSRKYDVFISHASEDKEFVRPLADALHALGVRVWYDEFELNIGDNLIASLNRGLKDSNYCILVLSPRFYRKDWPQFELESFFQLNREHILPVWHETNIDEVKEFFPYFANIISISSERGPEVIAYSIIKKARPDLFEMFEGRLRWLLKVEEAIPGLISPSELKPSPRRRERLAEAQLIRLQAVYETLGEMLGKPFASVYDSFLRDLNVEDEIQIWERIALIVRKYIKVTNCEANEKKRLLIGLLDLNLPVFARDIDKDRDNVQMWLDSYELNPVVFDIVREVFGHPSI